MHNFTPISATIGGLIIGFAVVLFFYTCGRHAGISGIFANAITSNKNKVSNLLFLLGLIVGPTLYYYFTNVEIKFKIENSYILILLAGFLVGFGTRMSGGCTSGHGICGISRFSFRSIIATIIFILSGITTVYLLQQFGFHI